MRFWPDDKPVNLYTTDKNWLFLGKYKPRNFKKYILLIGKLFYDFHGTGWNSRDFRNAKAYIVSIAGHYCNGLI
jgi:hypothetical protein